MQTITPAMQEALEQETVRLVRCCRLERKDGQVLCWSEHDVEIRVDGEVYQPKVALMGSAVTHQATLAVDGGEIYGLLDDNQMTEQDILAGIYDGAEMLLFWVDAEAPDAGKLVLLAGTWGEVQWQAGQFMVEIRGIGQRLQQQFVESYSPTCRARFGDARCGVHVVPLTVTRTVASAVSRSQWTMQEQEVQDGFYNYGTVRWLTGANAGLSMEVKWQQGQHVTLVMPMPYAIMSGDTLELSPGCDKRFSTCQQRYQNAVNFRGEPHVPGTQRLLETAATRSV